MLTTLVIVAIGLAAASFVLQAINHFRFCAWAAAQTRDHAVLSRVVDEAYPKKPRKPVLPPPPTMAFPLTERAGWGDDKLKTRNLRHGETFLPVDFRHDLW